MRTRQGCGPGSWECTGWTDGPWPCILSPNPRTGRYLGRGLARVLIWDPARAVPMGEQRGCQAMVPPAPAASTATRTPCPDASEKASQLPSPTGRMRLPAGAPRTAKGTRAMGQAHPGGQGRGCRPPTSGGPAQEPEDVGDGTCPSARQGPESSLPPPVPRGARTLPALWVRRARLGPTSLLRPVAGAGAVPLCVPGSVGMGTQSRRRADR